MLSFFAGIADRMIFESTRDYVDPEGRQRVPIPFSGGNFEAWITVSSDSKNDSKRAPTFALKFPGTGGRAERGGPHPCDVISGHAHEVWTINPPGYGTSDGRMSLDHLAETCDASWNAFLERAGSHRKIVVSNSLGSIYALYVAANYPVSAIYMRNPVPLRELILKRFAWWNLGLGAKYVANLIPEEMDAVKNAGRCRAPAFFVSSQLDRRIPTRFQQMIFDGYGGESTLFKAEGIGHHEPIHDNQVDDYVRALAEFGKRLSLTSPTPEADP